MTTDLASDTYDAYDAPEASNGSTWRERLNRVLVASVVAALLTLVATLIRMNERDLTFQLSPVDTFMQALGIYVLPATVLALVLIAAGMLGAFRHWFWAGVAGFVGGIVGGVIGYVQQILARGLELTGEAWGVVFLEFFGNNFAFLAFATLISAFAIPLVLRGLPHGDESDGPWGSSAWLADPRRFAGADHKVAFVRVPARNLDESQLSFIDRVEVDGELAAAQWESYVELLERYGWETHEVAAAETMPDSVFTEDPVVILNGIAVLTRSGAAPRRAELPGVRAAVERAGYVVEVIEKPGTLDGGDVLVVGDTVYVGASQRTNAAGIRALRRVATGLGYRVVAVPITGALHLKTIATALPDGTVLAWADALEQPELLGRVVPVPELLGASVLPLDAETVLVSAAAPRTAQLIERLGYVVEQLDISEFEKLEGGVTCLSARAFS